MQVCRVCLKNCPSSDCLDFNSQHAPEGLSIKFMLSICVPKMEIEIVREPVLCHSCTTMLTITYNFIQRCLKADYEIGNYLKGSSINSLNEICNQFSKTDMKLIEDIKSVIEDQLEIVKTEGCYEHDENINEGDLDLELQLTKKDHMSLKKKLFYCYNCGHKARHKQDLQKHLAIHNNTRIKCHLCEYKTESKFYLSRHISEVHKHMTSFLCSICGTHCKTLSTAQAHMADHDESKRHVCDTCGEICRNLNCFNQHMRKHKDERPFACDICNYTCTMKSYLQAHMRMHTKEKPFLCELCGFSATNNSHMIYHKQLHLGRKRFKCDFCDYRCVAKSSLNIHLRLHKGDRPFQCYTCGLCTVTKHHLIEHIRTHTGDKPFACKSCDYKASKQFNLKTHVLKQHPENIPKVKHLKCAFCLFTTSIPIALQEHQNCHITLNKR